jgi:DNA-binding transcriptional MerR regulator
MDKEIEKKYYSIGEVAEMLDISASQIRFWENEFDIIKPRKGRSGNRQFTQQDIKNIQLIYHLVKEKGYTLQGARAMLKEGTDEAMNKMEMVNSLKKVRSFLQQIRDKLDE